MPPTAPTPAIDVVVPARQGRAVGVSAGDHVTVTNTHGTQVTDFWAVDPAGAPGRHLSMAHTRAVLSRLVPMVGDRLYDNAREPMLELVEDTSRGDHDTLIAACDVNRYRLLGHLGRHDNCSDNFHAALAALGTTHPTVPDPFNLFMHIPWGRDGNLRFEPPTTRPGDRVTFLALRDAIIIASACPQDMVPINGLDQQVRDVAVSVRPAAAVLADGRSEDTAHDAA